MYILGIESSCDDTAIGLTWNNEIISHKTYSHIEENSHYGGVVPEISARQHVEKIDVVLQAVLKEVKITMSDISLIGVTTCPGLQGSLLVGSYFAYTLGKLFNIPVIPVHHIEAHLLVNDPVFPCDAFILSGGHTMLVRLKDFFNYEIIGQTLDDSMGEYIDKVGRQLGLPFPAGPHLEKYFDPNITKSPLTIPMKGKKDFSFSGLKTQTLNIIKNYSREEICTFMLITIKDILKDKIDNFVENPIIMGGGVTANSYIRQQLEQYKPYFPPKYLSVDNGIMIAKTAYYYNLHRVKTPSFNVIPSISIEQWKNQCKYSI